MFQPVSPFENSGLGKVIGTRGPVAVTVKLSIKTSVTPTGFWITTPTLSQTGEGKASFTIKPVVSKSVHGKVPSRADENLNVDIILLTSANSLSAETLVATTLIVTDVIPASVDMILTLPLIITGVPGKTRTPSVKILTAAIPPGDPVYLPYHKPESANPFTLLITKVPGAPGDILQPVGPASKLRFGIVIADPGGVKGFTGTGGGTG